MIAPAPRPASRLRRNLVLCTWDGLLATPLVFVTVPGNFIMAALLTTVFGMEKTMYGILASLPAWFNGAQILLVPLLAQRLSPRRMTVLFASAQLVCWLALCLALPLVPRENAPLAARLLFAMMALVSFTGSLAGVGWTSWVQEWVPRRLRGKYFGQRNRVVSLATMAFLLLAGEAVQWMDNSVTGYAAIFGVAGVLRFFSLLCQFRIPTTSVIQPATIHRGWWRGFSALWANRTFVRFVGFSAIAAFWMNFTGPFGPTFMYEHLDMNVSHVTLASIVGSLAGALSWPVWGRLADRLSCKTAIFLGLILWEVQNYLWVVLRPEINWLIYPMFAWGGLTAAGYFIGNFNMLLKIIPVESKTTAVSVNLAVTSLAAAVAPVLAGAILDWGKGAGLDPEMLYRGGFLLKSTAILLSLFLIRPLVEPAVGELQSIFGAMRTLRQTVLMEGLAIAANLTLVRGPGRKPRG